MIFALFGIFFFFFFGLHSMPNLKKPYSILLHIFFTLTRYKGTDTFTGALRMRQNHTIENWPALNFGLHLPSFFTSVDLWPWLLGLYNIYIFVFFFFSKHNYKNTWTNRWRNWSVSKGSTRQRMFIFMNFWVIKDFPKCQRRRWRCWWKQKNCGPSRQK